MSSKGTGVSRLGTPFGTIYMNSILTLFMYFAMAVLNAVLPVTMYFEKQRKKLHSYICLRSKKPKA